MMTNKVVFYLERLGDLKEYRLEKPHVVVTISDPGKPKPKTLSHDLTRLDWLNICCDDSSYNNQTSKCLSDKQAKEIVRFVHKHFERGVDDFILACEGQKSRIASIASAFGLLYGMKNRDSLKKYNINSLIFTKIYQEYTRLLENG